MTKTRDLANLVSGSNPLVDGVIDYSEITNTPAPFDPATLASVAVSGAYADLGGKPALATVATSGSFTDLSNQPTPFDPATLASVATTGAYSSLSGTPALAAVATTGAYSSLSGVPALAAVATSGAYSSLSGTPAAALPLTGGTLSGTLSTPALNIGGTQVISNARALNNIASVDATTAASITAAGVGGSSPAFSYGGTTGSYGVANPIIDISSIVSDRCNIMIMYGGTNSNYSTVDSIDMRVGANSGSYQTAPISKVSFSMYTYYWAAYATFYRNSTQFGYFALPAAGDGNWTGVTYGPPNSSFASNINYISSPSAYVAIKFPRANAGGTFNFKVFVTSY